ncbi:MAG: hypothetical protein R2710_06290 [Acidimicrobiales bacterium]
MAPALSFHSFELDPNEHRLDPNDRVRATYLVANRDDSVVLGDIVLTHHDRVDNGGAVILRCEPGQLRIEGELTPHEERQVSLELFTNEHLPGRHTLQVTATFSCRPVSPEADARFEYTVAAD